MIHRYKVFICVKHLKNCFHYTKKSLAKGLNERKVISNVLLRKVKIKF